MLASLVLVSSAVRLPAAEGKFSEQAPAIAESVVRTAAADAPQEAETARPPDFSKGPVPQWIWGRRNVGERDRFVFRREFDGGTESAWLVATCDNHMVVSINGRRVVESSEWQAAVRVDVQKYLKAGKNVIEVQAANEGGPAGFVAKLVLKKDGRDEYVVTDDSWQAAENRDADQWQGAVALARLGASPWGNVFDAAGPALQAATPRNVFNVLPGFQVELLYTVPGPTQGSWVAVAFDDKGRLIASDQGDKGLYRVTPPPIGSSEPTKVEKLDIKATAAQGILHAFDSLYLSINGGPGSGFYRARDTNGDDQYDEVTKLKPFQGGGEHGPHAVRLSPDGKSLYVVAGNHTQLPRDFSASRIPTNWDEDLLLPRQWDAQGHARGVLAPGGWICRTDPDGSEWDVVSIGYRNAYSIAFNADGELFAYDADMEWDMGTPWYRPTRVNHATSGSEFGWRSGTGKWPAYYIDSLPEVVDIGPGSPVGVTFGTGAKFPAKYQKATFLLDWTFGTIYAVHLEPDGATYKGVTEEFLSRTPLPLTDAAVGPDGALYFATGGRGTQSELFRVTYVGDEPTDPVDARTQEGAELRALRHRLEDLHTGQNRGAEAVEFLWPHLGHEDRFIRYAARVALEHQDTNLWQDRALSERRPQALLEAMVALSRQGDAALQPRVIDALGRLDFAELTESQQLDLLRTYGLCFIRMGQPDQSLAAEVVGRLDRFYPAETDALNRELCTLLVYLQSPTVIDKTLALMEQEAQQTPEELTAELLARNPGYGGPIAKMLSNTPEIQKIHYAFALRTLRYGWTLEQRQAYFRWFESALQRSGGASYQGFIQNIRNEALENLSPAERQALDSQNLLASPVKTAELPKPHGPGREWSLEDLTGLAGSGLTGRSFENGRRAYAAARCFVCHRFDGEGGATGPDLSNLAGRFSLQDLAAKIIDPNSNISDQYRASVIATLDGDVITGRVTAQQNGKLTVLVDPEDPTKAVEIEESQIDEIMPSKVSLMPKDLLNPLNQDEVLDLLAYLMSRGNPQDRMFQKTVAAEGQ